MDSTVRYTDPEGVATAIIERTGGHIVLALPLGLGKANHIVDALTRRALDDPTLRLEILTALTLEVPPFQSELERRFMEPALARLFGEYPVPQYAQLLRRNALPANIQVFQFFLQAGQWLDSSPVQQAFIPANYTDVWRYLLDRGVNVVAQLLAEQPGQAGFSLSCNPDITVDLLRLRRQGQCRFLFAGQCNRHLPFMDGEARISDTEVDLLLQDESVEFPLFAVPKRPLGLAEHAIGLRVARLVRDDGTLQIGIGSIGDAVTSALLLRHQQPQQFAALLQRMGSPSGTGIEATDSFTRGLYGVTEMLVDGFLHLAEAGILKREVDEAVVHAAFFLDSQAFYQRLRSLTPEQRRRFQMMPVSFTNTLTGDEEKRRGDRVRGTFINSAMLVTLRGAVISDALDDGRVVSGVGGLHDFAVQAFALSDARFIVALNATRHSDGKPRSNIVWSYAHTTLPWNLRDIVVTEYGAADLRGKTDNEAIKALLGIADSRFQGELLSQAVSAGKVEPDWRIPERSRNNTPAALEAALRSGREAGILNRFPFGTEFSDVEQRLLGALGVIKQHAHSRLALAGLVWRGLRAPPPDEPVRQCLLRLQLGPARDRGVSIRDRLLTWLVLGALDRDSAPSSTSP